MGELLVSTAYIEKLVELGNEKMHRNWARTEALLAAFTSSMLTPQPATSNPSSTTASCPMPQHSQGLPQPPHMIFPPRGLATPGGQTRSTVTDVQTDVHSQVPGEPPSGRGISREAVRGNGKASSAIRNVQQAVASTSHVAEPQGLGPRDPDAGQRGEDGTDPQAGPAAAREGGSSPAVDAGTPRVPALFVRRQQAKALKDALKALGWLEVSIRLAQADTSFGFIALPITDAGVRAVNQAGRPSPCLSSGEGIAPGLKPQDALQPGSEPCGGVAASASGNEVRVEPQECGPQSRGDGSEVEGLQVGMPQSLGECEGKGKGPERRARQPVDLNEAEALVLHAIEVGSAYVGTAQVQGPLPKRVAPQHALRTAVRELLSMRGEDTPFVKMLPASGDVQSSLSRHSVGTHDACSRPYRSTMCRTPVFGRLLVVRCFCIVM